MDCFNMAFYIYFLVILQWSTVPHTLAAPQPHANPEPQTGSSFFYYFSPNQPMVVNSQTFGSNPQAYHATSTNPFDFIPSDQAKGGVGVGNEQQTFLPQRNAYNSIPSSQSSLLDKIAFTHGPAIPTHPSTSSQYHYNYHTKSPPSPPIPTQPSSKLFNFLNQPFPFFQNNFNRFQTQQEQQNNKDQGQQQQPIYNENNGLRFQPPQEIPSRLTTLLPTQLSDDENEQNRQHLYTYYDRKVPSGIEHPKTTPLTFLVNQYFTSKTTQGPASYTFTIEANPTAASATAKVQVSVGGSDVLPSTFPTLSPLLFHPSRFQVNQTTEESNSKVNEENKVSENNSQYQEYDEERVSSQPTTTTQPTTSTTPIPTPPELLVPMLGLELVPPAISSSETPKQPTSIPSTTTSATLDTTPISISTTSTPTTSTTTTNIDIEQENVKSVGRRPVKRVIIIRKKLIRDGEQRVSFENDKQPESKLQQQNELSNLNSNEKFQKQIVLPSSTPTIFTTTPIEELTTTTTTTIPPPIQKAIASITFPYYYNTYAFNEPYLTSRPPLTTTKKPTTTTTTEPPTAESKISSSSSTVAPQIHDDYEYYEYYDEQSEAIPTTKKSILSNTITTTTEPLSSTDSQLSELNSSTETIHSHRGTDNESSDLKVTTFIPTILEDEEVIEPLSTTEPPVSSTTSTTTASMTEHENEVKIEQPTTASTTTTERITITTYRPNEPLENEQDIIATTTTTSTTTELPIYDDPTGAEVGGESFSNVTNIDMEKTIETTTVNSNTTQTITQNETSVTFLFESSSPQNERDIISFPNDDEYFHSQEEEYFAQHDPLEDEKIHEAQRMALQNALKNLRTRQQNTSTTEKPDEENLDPSKKFIRRPTKVNSFPSSTSISVSISSSHEHQQEDEDLGSDSRSNIIHKIQTFRTKLRKVVNRTGRKLTTTKRPRRVTRPSTTLFSGSSTFETDNLNTEEQTQEPSIVSLVDDKSLNSISVEPEKVVVQSTTTSTAIKPISSTSTSTTPSPPPPDITTFHPQLEHLIVTPKVLVGSLIITEILPSPTTPSTTKQNDDETVNNNNVKSEEPLDFETEDDNNERMSPRAKPIKQEEITSTPTSSTDNYNIINTNNQNESVVVETSTSRTIRERKVKVVLKRRKGAPKGTGTVARQVVRTRTRKLKPQEEVIVVNNSTENV